MIGRFRLRAPRFAVTGRGLAMTAGCAGWLWGYVRRHPLELWLPHSLITP